MVNVLTCPLCGSQIEDSQLLIDAEVIKFLKKLKKDNTLNPFLKISSKYIDIASQTGATSALVSKGINIMKEEVKDAASTELNNVVATLPSVIQETLIEQIPNPEALSLASTELNKIVLALPSIIQETLKDKIPNPDTLTALANALPELLIYTQRLIEQKTVPSIKGERAEQELADELSDFFPEDIVTRLGKSGESDILLNPRRNGVTTGIEVIIESKDTKKWNRSYISTVRKHMANKNTQYAILSVETMPRGSNGYLSDNYEEGVIFITKRSNTIMVYGALREILLHQYFLGKKVSNLQVALSDKRIQGAINTALLSVKPLQDIRKSARQIKNCADKIITKADNVEDGIKLSIQDMQKEIQSTLNLFNDPKFNSDVQIIQ